MSFIGEKKIKETRETADTTPAGEPIIKVVFQDGAIEHYSSVMFKKIVSDKRCSLEELRDKRCKTVVEILLTVLREWGIKLNELGYISALLNTSLDFNRDAALRKLWGQWMPTPIAPDDVDLINIDRVLRHAAGTNDKTK